MYTLTQAQAIQAVQQHANNNTLTVAQLGQLLGNASITFAQIMYVTKVQLAAAHKQENIQKVTNANVILCSNIKAHTSVYANKVKRSAAQISTNDPAAVEAFQAQQNYYEHTECYSIVRHREHTDKFYLYAIYNSAKSVYMHNGNIVDEQHVAQYMTPSGAKALLNPAQAVHNVSHNIDHTVAVRTIALSNIVSVRARKQLATV